MRFRLEFARPRSLQIDFFYNIETTAKAVGASSKSIAMRESIALISFKLWEACDEFKLNRET